MTRHHAEGEVSRTWVDHIPVVWVEPSPRDTVAPLALWLHPLSRSKEDSVPFLKELAGAGFVTVGFDAWQHGEHATESGEQILGRVFGGFRRHMWPILGQTTLDALRLLDWALAELGAGPEVVAGGVSMGGDVAVALAGVDERISRVAALVSTPDWTRPGMRDLWHPSHVVAQGEADAYARGPATAFECGAEDAPALSSKHCSPKRTRSRWTG